MSISGNIAAQICTGVGTRAIVVETCSATSESEPLQLQLWPNPADGYVSVKNADNELKFNILNSLGTPVLEINLPANSAENIGLQDIPSGIYMAHWQFKNGSREGYSRMVIIH